MITTGKRQLKEITDEELKVIVDISRCYGAKEFWGDIIIDRINRRRYENEIVITYKQINLEDGRIAKWKLFFDFANLRYFYAQYEPFERTSKNYSVCENTQMFLWLMTQDFNVLECLTVAPVTEHRGGHNKEIVNGFVVYEGIGNVFKDKSARFFDRENMESAFEYAKESDLSVFGLIEINDGR